MWFKHFPRDASSTSRCPRVGGRPPRHALSRRLRLESLEDRCLLSYTPIDLGALGLFGSTPRAVNDANQVVGLSSTTDGSSHAFLWDNGLMTDLGTLGGPSSQAADINDSGQVVGLSQMAAGPNHAFLWQNGTMTDLNIPSAGSEAAAISNSGVIVGRTYDLNWENWSSFVWQNGVAVDLASMLPANSGWTDLYVNDVNDHGQIVGRGQFDGEARAFLYLDTDGDGLFATGPGQIVDLLGTRSVANAINERGQIAGGAPFHGEFHGFLWTPAQPNGTSGTLKDLGRLSGFYSDWQPASSAAYDLNDAGDAVGDSTEEWFGNFHAVVSAGGTRFKDLNGEVSRYSNWELSSAWGINNSGWIVGSGANGGWGEGFLLIPGSVATPLLSLHDATVTEGDTGTIDAIFTVTLSKASTQAVTVDYATLGYSAAAGSDFVPVSGTLTFAPGETTRVIAVPVIGDTVPEWNESFFVTLSNPTGALFADSRGVGAVVDDDGRFSIDDVTVPEGNMGTTSAIFTVTLSKPSPVNLTVDFQTLDGTAATAENDYLATSDTLTFVAGETAKTISVQVLGDTIYEPDEYFSVQLSNSLIGRGTGVGTILNDDPKPKPGGNKTLTAETTADGPFNEVLSQADAQAFTGDALARWEPAGAESSLLYWPHLPVANLGGHLLGTVGNNMARLDDNVAGQGFFVNPTPADDAELLTPVDRGEQRRMDLLSAGINELGNLRGQDNPDQSGVIARILSAGVHDWPTAVDELLFSLVEEL